MSADIATFRVYRKERSVTSPVSFGSARVSPLLEVGMASAKLKSAVDFTPSEMGRLTF
jgi:hypothetical protein